MARGKRVLPAHLHQDGYWTASKPSRATCCGPWQSHMTHSDSDGVSGVYMQYCAAACCLARSVIPRTYATCNPMHPHAYTTTAATPRIFAHCTSSSVTQHQTHTHTHPHTPTHTQMYKHVHTYIKRYAYKQTNKRSHSFYFRR